MKKKLCLLFSVLLMVLSCVPSITAQAAGFVVDADTGLLVDKFTTFTVTTGTEKENSSPKGYGVYITSDTNELVVPIDFNSKGVWYFKSYMGEDAPDTATGLYDIYSDEACTQVLSYSSYSNAAFIPDKGTYYVKFSITDTGSEKPEGYIMLLYSIFYNGEDKSLTNKTFSCTGNSNAENPVYYKISVPKTGSITINTESEYTAYVTLLDSSKKTISNEASTTYANNYSACFAVTKGTYYIKVNTTSETYRLKYTFKAITDASGTTKAKAVNLTPGKTYTGVVLTSDKTGKVDWYKITLSKSQKVDITFTGSVSSGEIAVEFYGSGLTESITDSITTVNEDRSFSSETGTSTKLPKGTYYIKVSKAANKTSGFYNIKFNK